MRYTIYFLLLIMMACQPKDSSHFFSEVHISKLLTDSISIRAITLSDDNLYYGGNKGKHGIIDLQSKSITKMVTQLDTLYPEFRAIASNDNNVFLLSVASPALMYRMDPSLNQELVYREDGEGVFYDAMKFWNKDEGIAIGDIMDGCLSIIITRDGGSTWNKLDCQKLPKGTAHEGAFAASNTNIELKGDEAWIGTTSSRIYYTSDKGLTWKTIQTPIVKEKETQGIYSIDFYDHQLGIAFGGDYTDPELNTANKAITRDGGQSWSLIADAREPGYKSCVQFVPGSGGNDIVAVGFTGIHYSSDQGENWTKLSDQSLYTIRFLNDSLAYGAGANVVAKLTFK